MVLADGNRALTVWPTRRFKKRYAVWCQAPTFKIQRSTKNQKRAGCGLRLKAAGRGKPGRQKPWKTGRIQVNPTKSNQKNDE